jgi:hypothetical protein
MYSVMAIFKSSIVWGLFEYTEFFIAQRLFDHPVHTNVAQRDELHYWTFLDIRKGVTSVGRFPGSVRLSFC